MAKLLKQSDIDKFVKTGKSKYRNKKVEWRGEKFDSKKEMEHYIILVAKQQSGLISNLRRQVRYEIIPATKTTRKTEYIADFVYTDNQTGEEKVVDAKGFRTEVYKIKKKLMLVINGINIKEV